MEHVGGALTHARLLTTLAALGCVGGHFASGAGSTPVRPVSAADIRSHVEFLASDALLGRQTPSVGLGMAAGYVQQELMRHGLRPGMGGGYVQHFPYSLMSADPGGARLRIGGRSLSYGTDFTVLPGGSASGTTASTEWAGQLPAALASRSLDSMQFRGIAVLHLSGYPSVRSRQVAAMARSILERRGARGVIFLVDSGVPVAAMQRAARLSDDAAREQVERYAGIPAVFVRDPATLGLLTGGRPVEVTLASPRRVVAADSAPNVIAVLLGRDPALRADYIVVSAHMDHIGTASAPGDSIFNGADDNASGTAALMEIARTLAQLPLHQRPRRSVLFLAVSGEEHGLLGSQWFAANSPIPVARIVANVNLDMVGRNARDTVYAIGMEYSTLGPMALAVSASFMAGELQVVPDPRPDEGKYQRSDQFSFARRGIPAIALSGGSHRDYHAVTDEVSRLDMEKVARVARLASEIVRRIADADAPPQWSPAGRSLLSGIGVP